jgi:uncharacterized protein (TIGR02996 family)
MKYYDDPDYLMLFLEIQATPEDTSKHLALADWLEAQEEKAEADMIRLKSPGPELLRWTRTQVGRTWFRRAIQLCFNGKLPSSLQMWPVEDPEEYPNPKHKIESWAYYCGICTYQSSKTPFVVCFRHGFIDAVAANIKTLVKYLPAVCARQPVRRVAVTNLYFEDEDFVRWLPFDQRHKKRRVIRQRTDGVPDSVWLLLKPMEMFPSRFGGEGCALYPSLEEAHQDLGRAFLEWANGEMQAERSELHAMCL